MLEGILSKELIEKHQFAPDGLLLKMLDQVWIQTVTEPNYPRLVFALNQEISTVHEPDRICEL